MVVCSRMMGQFGSALLALCGLSGRECMSVVMDELVFGACSFYSLVG